MAKISALSNAAALGGTEQLPGVQSAANVNITPTQIKTFGAVGTTTNDNAATGSVGQLIESNIASPGSAITSATATDITSISLTAGDWDVWGVVAFIGAAGTTTTVIGGGISQTSATLPTSPAGGGRAQINGTLGTAATNIQPVGMLRISLASTTTIYLVASTTFAVSTCTAYGYIGARRRR